MVADPGGGGKVALAPSSPVDEGPLAPTNGGTGLEAPLPLEERTCLPRAVGMAPEVIAEACAGMALWPAAMASVEVVDSSADVSARIDRVVLVIGFTSGIPAFPMHKRRSRAKGSTLASVVSRRATYNDTQ